MLAFFMSCMLFEMDLFDSLSESNLYLLTFAVYSYVIFDIACNRKAVIACVIILTLSITFAYDAYFYGQDGIHGVHETAVYNNIERLALFAHSLFIAALIPYRRVGDSCRRFIGSFLYISRNSAYFVPI